MNAPGSDASDLAEAVDDYLADIGVPDDPMSSWQVHRNIEDGSAAVVYCGSLPGGAPVRAQVLGGYANALRAGGFLVDEETCWPEQDAPADGGLLWLHVTGRENPSESGGNA